MVLGFAGVLPLSLLLAEPSVLVNGGGLSEVSYAHQVPYNIHLPPI